MNIYKVLWIVGLVLWAIGQGIASFNKSKGDTTSETWRDLPEPVKYLTFGALCATLAHWVWPMPARDDVTVNVNVEKEVQ